MKTFTSKVVEICDNGDAIVELPPELLEEMGWKEGDTLDISEKDGRVIIKKIDEEHRKKSLDKWWFSHYTIDKYYWFSNTDWIKLLGDLNENRRW